MASVSFTFNLEPATSVAKQGSASAATESSAAIGAKYESVQTNVQGASHLSGLNSPACVGGDCFVVHGEGPGVTTLSSGEEEGVSGDFITLPVVDGSLFLEPPVTDFAVGGAEYDVTTLAIGEEDGGIATASPEIGGGSPLASSGNAVESGFSMEPIYDSQPTASAGASQVASAPLGAIQTTPILTPLPKPSTAGATIASVQNATASSPLPPIQTVPIIEPTVKPTELASNSFPVPETKPETITASAGVSGASAASPAASSGSNFVSVGDYDSYLASLGGSGSSAPIAGNIGATAEAGASPIYAPPPLAPFEAAAPAAAQTASSAVYAPPPLAPIEPFNLQPVGADSITVSYRPPPLAPIEPFNFSPAGTDTATITHNSPPAAPGSAAPARVEVVFQPATSPAPAINAIEASAAPRMKPASFTTPGPATLSPIQTVPIEIEVGLPPQTSITDATAPSTQFNFAADTGSTFATVDAPIPAGKPEGIGIEAPRLSDDDFRITTLALGEEDSGGG